MQKNTRQKNRYNEFLRYDQTSRFFESKSFLYVLRLLICNILTYFLCIWKIDALCFPEWNLRFSFPTKIRNGFIFLLHYRKWNRDKIAHQYALLFSPVNWAVAQEKNCKNHRLPFPGPPFWEVLGASSFGGVQFWGRQVLVVSSFGGVEFRGRGFESYRCHQV